ncbi:MAG TPA: hypothetical protein VF483_12945, partial [Gemmatimonadaceae bacterium]
MVLYRGVGLETITATDAAATLATVGLVMAATIVVLVAAAYAWLSVGLWRAQSIWGSSARSRVIIFGVVSYLFPALPWALFVQPVQFIARLAEVLPNGIRTVTYPVAGAGPLTAGSIADQFLAIINGLFRDFGNTLGFAIQNVDMSRVLLAMALGGLLGMWTSTGVSAPVGTASAGQRFIDWWNRLSEARRERIALASVLIGGVYLAIAAIVAIPYLIPHTETNAGDAQVALRNQLAAVVPDSAKFEASHISIRPDSEVFRLRHLLDSLLPARGAATEPGATSDRTAQLANVREQLDRIIAERAKGIDNFFSLWNRTRVLQGSLASTALDAFAKGGDDASSEKARARYASEILEWVQVTIARSTQE